jgi:biopolymer transport protein ExbD
MKISGQRGYLVALESVAMTDIVLNMFIFFFISFSLLYTFNTDRVHSIKITLPVAGNADPLKNVPEARVTVTRGGELYLDAKKVGEEDLKNEIARRKTVNPDLKIVLRSDAQASFQDAVRVLSIVSECRIRILDIAVLKGKEGPLAHDSGLKSRVP